MLKRFFTMAMAIMLLTVIHHLYGAAIYSAPFRLHVVYFAAPVMLLLSACHVVYHRYPKSKLGTAAILLLLLIGTGIPMVLIGIIEGGYNHLVKNLVYFGGASEETFRRLFPGPNYEIPSDFLFEFSGMLQFIMAMYAVPVLYSSVKKLMVFPFIQANRLK
ncbi:hypothetical protein [Negadavirga shengliensis]|uniref:Uncharacterized protein n=1 Tax=Negadavirga shengliensis TaxID=1389218 RepID=A0ABV9SWI1_9BACT